MKRHFRKSTLFILLTFASAAVVQASEISWEANLEAARSTSARTGRLMMVESMTSWCPYCKKYETQIYPSEKVVQAVEPFVAVKIDAEKAGKPFAKQYRVQGYPTFLFLDSSGAVIRRFAGKSTVDGFSALLDEVTRDYHDFPALQTRVKNNPRDTDAAFKLLTALVQRERPADAAQLVAALEAQVAPPLLGKQYNMVAVAYATGGNSDEAIAWYQKSLANSHDGAALVAAHKGLFNVYRSLKNSPAMEQQLQSIIDLPEASAAEKDKAAARLKEILKDEDR